MNVESIFFCKRIPEKESAARKERMLMSHALFYFQNKNHTRSVVPLVLNYKFNDKSFEEICCFGKIREHNRRIISCNRKGV